ERRGPERRATTFRVSQLRSFDRHTDRSGTRGIAHAGLVRGGRPHLSGYGAPQRTGGCGDARAVRARRREDRALRELRLWRAAARGVHVPVQHRLSWRGWDGAPVLDADSEPARVDRYG